MKRTVLLLLLAGALILVAWPLLVPGLAPEGPAAPRPAPERAPASPPPTPPESPEPETPEPERKTGIDIRVFGPDGKPVPRASGRVWVVHGRAIGRHDLTFVEGRVRGWPVSGEWDRLWIEVHGAAGAGAAFHGPVEPNGAAIEIRLPPPLSISGTLVDDEGVAVPGVTIAARAELAGISEHTTRLSRIQGKATTDQEGRFRLAGLGEFEHELRVEVVKGYAPCEPVSAKAGDEAVRIVLARVPEVVITVLDPDGRALPRAKVEVEIRGREAKFEAVTDAEGRAAFPSVPVDARIWVAIQPPEDRLDVLAAKPYDGPPEDGVVRLEPALPLAGRVEDANGDPVPLADFMWCRAGSEDGWTMARTDEEGRFRIPRVPDVDIELRVSADFRNAEVGEMAVFIVKAGREDVVLSTAPTPSISLRIDDWPENSPANAFLVLENREDPVVRVSMVEERTVRFAGLRKDDVATILVTTWNGWVWLRKGLRPNDEVQVVTGTSTEKITGTLLGAPAGRKVTVAVELLPGRFQHARMQVGGRFELPGVPEGTWKLRAYTHDEGDLWEGFAEAKAGGDVEIRLIRR